MNNFFKLTLRKNKTVDSYIFHTEKYKKQSKCVQMHIAYHLWRFFDNSRYVSFLVINCHCKIIFYNSPNFKLFLPKILQY